MYHNITAVSQVIEPAINNVQADCWALPRFEGAPREGSRGLTGPATGWNNITYQLP